MYEPREDSYLLAEQVKKNATGKVLEIGTGSGIQAKTAAENKSVKKVLAVDIDEEALKFAKKNNFHKKITYKKSNLFSTVKGKYDTIIFNAPYLPEEKDGDIALYGGKKGYEILEKFLNKLKEYLSQGGLALIVYSSLTNKPKIEEILRDNMLGQEELAKEHIFFEDIYVMKVTRQPVLIELEKRKITNITFLARGKRGLVYTGKYRGKKVAIKIKNPKSDSMNTIQKEAEWLKKVNKLKIGPQYYFHTEDYIVYKFIEGKYLEDWIVKATKKQQQKIIKELFEQARKMDNAGINKREMTRPLRNAIVGKKVTLIDFERARQKQHPHNVTQLTQFIRNWKQHIKIRIDIDKLKEASQEYKEQPNNTNYEKILTVLGI